MNALDIDAEALAAEAAALELPGEPLAAPAAAEGPADAEDSGGAPWAVITPGIVAGVDLFICPGWRLTDAEKGALAEALAPALDAAFPGGIGDERYAPYFRLLIVAGGIVALRYDRDAGRLQPLRDRPAPAATSGAAPGGSFSTMGPDEG